VSKISAFCGLSRRASVALLYWTVRRRPLSRLGSAGALQLGAVKVSASINPQHVPYPLASVDCTPAAAAGVQDRPPPTYIPTSLAPHHFRSVYICTH